MPAKKRQTKAKSPTERAVHFGQRRGLALLLGGMLILLALAGVTVLITSSQSSKQAAESTLNAPASSPYTPPPAVAAQAPQLPPAPDVTLPTLAAEPFRLAAHRGEVVLLYFSFPG